MFSRVGHVVSLGRRSVALTLLLFAAGCSPPTVPAPKISPPGEWHTFEGTWSASGTRQTLKLEADHRASIFDLTGWLLLQEIWVGSRVPGEGH